jgi:hypothetical protein
VTPQQISPMLGGWIAHIEWVHYVEYTRLSVKLLSSILERSDTSVSGKYSIVAPKPISLSFWVEWYPNMLHYGLTKRLPKMSISLTSNIKTYGSVLYGRVVQTQIRVLEGGTNVQDAGIDESS